MPAVNASAFYIHGIVTQFTHHAIYTTAQQSLRPINYYATLPDQLVNAQWCYVCALSVHDCICTCTTCNRSIIV